VIQILRFLTWGKDLYIPDHAWNSFSTPGRTHSPVRRPRQAHREKEPNGSAQTYSLLQQTPQSIMSTTLSIVQAASVMPNSHGTGTLLRNGITILTSETYCWDEEKNTLVIRETCSSLVRILILRASCSSWTESRGFLFSHTIYSDLFIPGHRTCQCQHGRLLYPHIGTTRKETHSPENCAIGIPPTRTLSQARRHRCLGADFQGRSRAQDRNGSAISCSKEIVSH
jgi:hypothetical protein